MVQLEFQGFVETAPDLIGVLDRDQRYVYVNAALEHATGVPGGGLIGTRADEVIAPDEARGWREAVEDVLRTGRERAIECTIGTPHGPHRFASLITPLPGEHACAVWRDITDVRSSQLLDLAVRTMAAGMVVVEAPSGRILFMNDATDRVFGKPSRVVNDMQDYEAVVAFDQLGRRISNEAWPISRALAGQVTVGERVEVHRHDGARRTISIDASPVRDRTGSIIAAVSTYHDITRVRRADEAARYLAASGALLERFDPETSLQAIVDLAVPVLADWCFIYLKTAGHPAIVAIANADPARVAMVRAGNSTPQPLPPETAVARVLAGGPRELVAYDRGYRSAVVAPLAGREGVLGAVVFAMAESGRHYDEADLDMLAELARRTGIALENARLFAAEQRARRQAEEARDRMRRLQALTAALSSAVEQQQVVSIMVDAGRDALGADGGFAWMLRDDDILELAAVEHAGRPGRIDQFRTIPITARLPVSDVIRTAQPMMFEDLAAMARGYPQAIPTGEPAFRAWAVIPFVVAGRGVGAMSFSFVQERAFSAEDRELLLAMTGQASLALERCMLVEAERRARADAEAARLRERELHVLAARLSSALTPSQVTEIVSEQAVSVLRGHAGVAAVQIGDDVQILGVTGPHDPAVLARLSKLPLAVDLPIAEAIRTSELVWCASEAEMEARYLHVEDAWREQGLRAWGAVPFAFEGRTTGALALSFTEDHPLHAEEREFLHAVGQLAAQALERARLYEALHASQEQLRFALTAARAAVWRLDLATMTSTWDASNRVLVGVHDEHGTDDLQKIHPDDRAAVKAQFERTLRDGVPFEPELRVRRDDGTYLWVRSHGRLTYGADGKPSVLAGVTVDIDEAKRASLRAEEERRINETLHRLGSSFASELDHDRLVRLITDEIAHLVGAELGVFVSSTGEGDDRFRSGMRSYLAVPVAASSGEVFGSLRFGHSEAGRFTAAHERLAASIAGHASVALENARLYKTVREQKDQLELAVEHARRADRQKDEFLAMLGHELRNPLAPIVTALDLMDIKGLGAMQWERDVIRRQVDHLSRLIDDLLDVSRITRGKIKLAREVLEIGAVLAKAIEMASPLLEKRMQPLAIDVPCEGLAVDADPTRLAQVFQNLLTNAAKYSEPRSRIMLHARGEADHIVVEVCDQGIGIPADILPRLFDLFVQGERALDRSEGGLGIGLTIAKRLCELHGGTIEAASAGSGRGSTFTVRLPRAARTCVPPAVRACPQSNSV